MRFFSGTSESRGRSMASLVRDELEAFLPDEVATLTDVVADVRRSLRREGIAPDADRWREAVGGEWRARAAGGVPDEARAWLLERLGVSG